MRSIMLSVLAVLFALSQAVTLSQSNAPPTTAIDITNADIEATLNSPDGGIDRQIRVVDMGKYNIAVGIIHRGPSAPRVSCESPKGTVSRSASSAR